MTLLRKPTIRFSELSLLLFPAAAAIVGVATAELARVSDVSLPTGVLRSGYLFAATILLVSLLLGLVGFRGDQVLLPVVATASMLGLVMILRLQPDLARRDRRLVGLADRQEIYLALGFCILAVVAGFFNHWYLLRRYKYTALAIGIVLLAATFFFGTPIGGARIWISIGPVQAQPSEVVKIALVLFLAAYLEDKRDLIGSSWTLGPLHLPPVPYLAPMGIMWATSLLVLVVENDLGSALLLFGIFLVMLYAATGRTLYVAVGLISFASACWVAYLLFDRIALRVQNWLDPWSDPLVGGYQQIQSEYAVAGGGFFGRGLGRGQPWRIPAVQTDYVFSAVAEELGLLGALAVVAIFTILVARGFAIGLRSDDTYLRLVAVGLSATLGLQAFIILGGVMRVVPLTGITLPFISYGGSSLLSNFLLVGLLLNISGQHGDQNVRR